MSNTLTLEETAVVRKLLLLPGKHLGIAVPLAVLAGLHLGLSIEVPQTPALLMPAVILMVYPIMIGLPWREVARLQPARLLLIATVLNFGLIPCWPGFWAAVRWRTSRPCSPAWPSPHFSPPGA